MHFGLETTVKAIEDAFKEFTTKEDIAIVLISQYVSFLLALWHVGCVVKKKLSKPVLLQQNVQNLSLKQTKFYFQVYDFLVQLHGYLNAFVSIDKGFGFPD